MSMREKGVLCLLGAGLVIMVSAGVLAFYESGRLLVSRGLAEEELQDLELLDSFALHLRDMRRKGLNYVLLGQESNAEDFRELVADLRGLREQVMAERADLGSEEEISRLLKDGDEYIEEWVRIVASRDEAGYEAAAGKYAALDQSDRFEKIINEVANIEKQNVLAYAERNKEMAEGVTRGMLAIGVSIVTATVLIVFSSVIIVRYYSRIRDLLAVAKEQQASIERKNSEMESIISIVSHDLRAPLLNIKGFSDEIGKAREALCGAMAEIAAPARERQIIDEALSETMPEALGFIRKGTESMHRLIENLVKVARAGQLPVNPEKVNMNEVIKGVLADHEFRIQQAGGGVKCEKLPDCVADAGQVRQVFANIIDNAIKYRDTSRGLEIAISGEVSGGKAVYCVADNGVGIAAGKQSKIFDMYHQIKNKNAQGEGLGLAIVKKIVERNGGKVEVESESGRGSRFFVYLNAA